ncbi:MAG: UrcA family protein [Steroidobacteraceae bacterium]
MYSHAAEEEIARCGATDSALIAATALAAVALSGPARAQAPVRASTAAQTQDAPSPFVHYAVVELSTPTGVRALYHRIRAAAWQVCGEMFPAPQGIENTRCRQALVDAAIDQVHSPALAAVHQGRQPASLVTARINPRSR